MTNSDTDSRITWGEFRGPKNEFANLKGSIHDDDVAANLGFRGGTIPGSVHLDQFAPLLAKAYGSEWFRTGSISIYFSRPTIHLERVKTGIEFGEGRSKLTMINEAGEQICLGTASGAANDEDSEFAHRIAAHQSANANGLRILSARKAGERHSNIPLRISGDELIRTLEVISEPQSIYGQEGALPPSLTVLLAHRAMPVVLGELDGAVGMFGALEVRHFRGPPRADAAYLGQSRLLKLSESPRTENAWYEVDLMEVDTGERIASVAFFTRFLKATSPLWATSA